MDFKSYAKNKQNPPSKTGSKEPSEDVKRTVEETVNANKGKTQEELMGEILREAQKQRGAGKLNETELDNFYNTMLPMLNPEQKSKLQEIMKLLK